MLHPRRLRGLLLRLLLRLRLLLTWLQLNLHMTWLQWLTPLLLC
jgi:hypothetical protein